MSRIKECFKNLQADGQTALIPYVTAGDPEPWVTVPLLHALVDAGADIIELGVPFSDPMSDGPVIQKACERALKNDVTLDSILDMVKQFREKNNHTPIVLMGYANPLEAMGYEKFAKKAQAVGVDGAKGFIYYVSIKGVTGAAALEINEVTAKLEEIRKYTSLPVGVGFGIRDGRSAAAVAEVADAVVVGSTLVRCIEEHSNRPQELPAAVASLLAEMRHAINARDLASVSA